MSIPSGGTIDEVQFVPTLREEIETDPRPATDEWIVTVLKLYAEGEGGTGYVKARDVGHLFDTSNRVLGRYLSALCDADLSYSPLSIEPYANLGSNGATTYKVSINYE